MEIFFRRVVLATQHAYRSHARHFQGYFGHRRLESITAGDIKEWRVWSLQKHAPATVKARQAFLSSVFREAMEAGLCTHNPCREARWGIPIANTRSHWVDEDVESRLRPLFDRDQWEAIQVAILTGMRRKEQWGLNWPDIDWKAKTIRVLGKRNKVRFVPMNRQVEAILRARHQRGYPRPFFGSIRWTEDIRLKLERVGVHGVTWHILGRHSFASRLANDGEDIYTIKELLGHASVATTAQRYAHLNSKKLRSAVDRLRTLE